MKEEVEEKNRFQQLKQRIGRLSKCDCRVTIQIQLNYKINMNIVLFSTKFGRT